MKSFLELNRQKLPLAFIANSLIFSLIALVLLIIIRLTNIEVLDLGEFILILFISSICFPIYIIGLAYIVWTSKRRVRNRAFNKHPFDELDKIGFTVSRINEKTKWSFTEETKEIKINGFLIQCDVYRGSPNVIIFKAFVKHKTIGKDRFKFLRIKFREDNIYFENGNLQKLYNLKNIENLSNEKLKSDLIGFVDLLIKERFEPADSKNGWT